MIIGMEVNGIIKINKIGITIKISNNKKISVIKINISMINKIKTIIKITKTTINKIFCFPFQKKTAYFFTALALWDGWLTGTEHRFEK